jgi:hypothetical protein
VPRGMTLTRTGAVLVLAVTCTAAIATLAGAQTADPAGSTTTSTTSTSTDAPTTTVTESPATTAAPAARAAVGPISGWVANGETSQPLDGICVVFYSVDGRAWDGATITNGDGFWSFTPAVSGAQRIAVFRPSVPGDCDSLPLATGPVPEWVYDVSLKPADPRTATPPPEAAMVVDGTDRVDICLGDTTEFRGGCDRKLTGTGTLAGTVVEMGERPVDAACIYVLTDLPGDSDVGWDAMTDATGHWQVKGLPTDRSYYVGVIGPFATSAGPCHTDNGPPPAPAAGELQPEFYANAWVDLGSPDLDTDPAGYAARNGAVAVEVGASDVDVCLTTEPGSTTLRADCTETTSDTTPTTAAAAATTAGPAAATTESQAPAATATTGTLPLTGRDPAGPAAVGAVLVAAGGAAVLASRRRRPHGA